MRVIVIGAGISGLAAAWHISQQDPSIQVEVLEAAPVAGGTLRVASVAGLAVDVGAEAMLARRPEGVELARAAGLGELVITPLTTSASVYAGGAAHPLPAGTLLGIPSDVIALRRSGVLDDDALATVEGEPRRPPLDPLTDDVAVGALVRPRLGDEVVDRLVEPLLGGVYAGRADELSLRATMPALATRLRQGGSLLQAARAVTDAAANSSSSGPVFASLVGGLGRLPTALAASGKFRVRTGVTVRAIRRTPAGFALDCGPVPTPQRVEADGVIVATPAAKAARLLGDVAPAAAGELSTVDAASMAIVTLAFEGVTPPSGSGLLVGRREARHVKAITLSSQKWPGTPAGLTVLRASVGRAGETTDLQRDDSELTELVLTELPALIGVNARPIDSLVTRWGGGLPQYAVGHVEKVGRIRDAVAAVPGLAVCGATFDGVGIPACIASARRAADRVLSRERQ